MNNLVVSTKLYIFATNYKNMKCCINCGKNEISERKRCRECALIYNRERVKKYNTPEKKRYGVIDCSVCGKKLIKGRPNQISHGACKVHYLPITDYNKFSRSKKGNTIARQMVLDLGFKLTKNIVVHHLDENPENNVLSNFCLLSLQNHTKLHQFFKKQWSLLAKVNSSNLENCWNILRDQLTTTWLEITGVNVIKIIDIGQSAAESLNEENVYFFQ